ncbi:MAG TPA: hypothetical protein VGH87_04710 [Polyangiaceae bacterium]|jgi:hypothetical protein
MKRLVACALVVVSAVFASAMTLGACGDSCVDTGCIEDTGPDVKEAGKKDAAKEAAVDATSDAPTDATNDTTNDASDDAADASAD